MSDEKYTIPANLAPGLYKSAIVMMALGEQEAAKIVRHLDPKALQQLTMAMTSINRMIPEEIQDAMVDMINRISQGSSISLDASSFLNNILKNAVGDDEAQDVLDRLRHGTDSAGIQALRWVDPETIAILIKDDHPQIIATILANLDESKEN